MHKVHQKYGEAMHGYVTPASPPSPLSDLLAAPEKSQGEIATKTLRPVTFLTSNSLNLLDVYVCHVCIIYRYIQYIMLAEHSQQ